MKVLFDSGSSVSLIAGKGAHFIPENLISPTSSNVWAANSQKLGVTGEATLAIELKDTIYHKFLITQNNISGCHALLGTDIFPKLDSFFLAGVRDLGASICMNDTIFPLNKNAKPNLSYMVLLGTNQVYKGNTYFIISSPSESINKLLDEDIDSTEIMPITEIDNGCTPDIPSANSDEERNKLFSEMLQDLDLSHLEPHFRESVLKVMNSVKGLFITSPNDPVGLIPDCTVRIKTTKGEPIRAKQRKFSPLIAAKVKQLNLTMLSKGIIEMSNSHWANPVVLVHRPGASTSLRMCLDLRELNKRIKFDSYPIAD